MNILNALIDERVLAQIIKNQYGDSLREKLFELAETLDVDLTEGQSNSQAINHGDLVETVKGTAQAAMLTPEDVQNIKNALPVLNRLFS